MSTTLRVILVDDDQFVLSYLADLIGQGSSIDEASDYRVQIVGIAASGAEAISLVREVRPDVVLMDLQMPGEVSGADAIRTITHGIEPPKVLALTAFGDDRNIRQALAAGADGYLIKAQAANVLVSSIIKAHEGEAVASPDVTKHLMNHLVHEDSEVLEARELVRELHEDERKAAEFLAQGKTYDQIAAQMYNSPSNVKKLLSRARRTVGAANSVELAVIIDRAKLRGVE